MKTIYSLNKIAAALLFGGVLCSCAEVTVPSQPVAVEHVQSLGGKASQLLPYGQRPFQDEVFYFVLPDRFSNGDTSNDLGAAANDTARALSRGGLDVNHKGMFHGGDLAGLIDKLPYLDEMGVTAIWLTPVLRNRAMQAGTSGYHGYWILDFTQTDPHLGTEEELQQFIDAAHRRNIKVFFDIITNHTADVIKYEECHDPLEPALLNQNIHCDYKPKSTLATDHYTPYIPAGETHVKAPAWLNDMSFYHNQGDSNWEGESAVKGDFAGLDDLDTSQPGVVSGMTDIYKNIISRFKPDGFRIDTVKHVDMTFWQQFSPALMRYAKAQGIDNFMMFGEVYSFDVSLLSQYVNKAKLPSVLDFAFQGALESVLVKQAGTDVLATLFAQDSLYHHEQGYNANDLVNFTGNHDMGRFAYKLTQSKFHYTDAQMTQRTQLAYAMIYFCRGVPVIYYGDEQGFVGDGGDQDSRQDMMPSFVASYNDDDLLATDKTTADDNFDPTHPLYNAFAQYAALYQQYPALRRGNQSVLYGQSTPGIFAIAREYRDDEGVSQRIAAVFNTSDSPQNINLPQLDNGHLLYASDVGQGAIKGLSFRLYQLN